jgi:hypothetical protein
MDSKTMPISVRKTYHSCYAMDSKTMPILVRKNILLLLCYVKLYQTCYAVDSKTMSISVRKTYHSCYAMLNYIKPVMLWIQKPCQFQ